MSLTANTLGGQTMKFYVGESREGIVVHLQLLGKHSRVFEDMLKLGNDGRDRVAFLKQAVHDGIVPGPYGMRLPDPPFDLQSVMVLVNFLYSNTLPGQTSFDNLFKIYEVASRFGIPALLNSVIDRFQFQRSIGRQGFTIAEIAKIHSGRDLGGGKLWEYCLSVVSGQLAWGKVYNEVGWVGAFKNFCDDNPYVPRQVIEMMLDNGTYIHQTEARFRGPALGLPFKPDHFHVFEVVRREGFSQGGDEVQENITGNEQNANDQCENEAEVHSGEGKKPKKSKKKNKKNFGLADQQERGSPKTERKIRKEKQRRTNALSHAQSDGVVIKRE